MAQVNTRGVALYSTLGYSSNSVSLTPSAIALAFEDPSSVAMEDLATSFIDISKVRELPEVGVPPSISSVAEFGSALAPQVTGQAEAPQLDVTLNYVPEEHDSLLSLSGDGILRCFRLRISNSPIPDVPDDASKISEVYWTGMVAAKLISVGTGDASSVVVTLTMDTEFTNPIGFSTT